MTRPPSEEDKRRPLRGVAPRSEPLIGPWAPTSKAGIEWRRERRAFILRMLNTSITWASYGMMQEQVEAHFGYAPSTATIESDLKAVGAVRVPMRPGSRRTKIVLLEGHTPQSLTLEMHDRFAVDVLRVIQHGEWCILDVSRGTTKAIHELLKIASEERMLPPHLIVFHDDEDTVAVLCTSSARASEWKDRVQHVLDASRRTQAVLEPA